MPNQGEGGVPNTRFIIDKFVIDLPCLTIQRVVVDKSDGACNTRLRHSNIFRLSIPFKFDGKTRTGDRLADRSGILNVKVISCLESFEQ